MLRDHPHNGAGGLLGSSYAYVVVLSATRLDLRRAGRALAGRTRFRYPDGGLTRLHRLLGLGDVRLPAPDVRPEPAFLTPFLPIARLPRLLRRPRCREEVRARLERPANVAEAGLPGRGGLE